MQITDPIADMFTRIRNGLTAKHDFAVIPHSNCKLSILKILKDEGYIKSYETVADQLNRKNIKVGLKYRPDGSPAISKLKRISKAGKRIHVRKAEVPKPYNGFGISIISTSKGMLSGKDARINNVGGELVGEVF